MVVLMATATLIPVSEYLTSVYRPDCDYVDGELQERNVGERPHSSLQLILAAIFHANRRAWHVVSFPELRVHVSKERYRIPDVCVLRDTDPADNVVQAAPLICIEILSPDDRINRMQERTADYARMGVENIWLFDPLTRRAWVETADGSLARVEHEFTVSGTPIRIVLADVFAELDDMQQPKTS